MPGDGRFDLPHGVRDFPVDPIGVWLQELVGDSFEVAYEGYSRAGQRKGWVRLLFSLF